MNRSRRAVLKVAGALALASCGEVLVSSDAGVGGGTGATGGGLGTGGGAAAAGGGVGAGGGDGASGGGTATGGGSTTGGGSATGGGTGFSGDAGVVTSAFAVGSGAFLSGKDYGDPFTMGLGSTCQAYPSSTEGPCHSNTFLRQDVSDGLIGLPTRFELLVVDSACDPVPGAIVEIWYASPAGTYSKAAEAIDAGTGYGGSLSDLNVGFCTGNDSTALASNWLRGYQIADANGRVTIDGIFPGWYSSRTTHVHFIITANGQSYVTSQLFFNETLTTAVYTGHGSYSSRGNKDTSNANDMVIQQAGLSSNLADATMAYAQQSDGAMVCWKAIAISA